MAQNRGPSHTIFIGNLPYDLTENDLANIFQEVGPVKHVRIVLDKETQKPKGFAFVEFFDIATAESAVRNMNNYEVNGRTIRVNFADDQPDRAGRGRGPGDFRGPPGAGPPMPEPPAAAKVPVGMPASASAAQAMSTMLGGPLIMGGPAQEQTNNALASLSRAQLFDIMSQMKLMAMQNSKQLRELLISHPQLSKALLQAQVMLGMVQQGAPAPVPAPGPMMQQQPGPMNGSGAYGGQPGYGHPGQAYPTGPQPMQQVPQNPAPMQPAPMQHQPMAPVQPQPMVHQPMQHQPMAPVQPQPMTSLKATPMQHVAPQPMTSLQQPQQSQPPPMQHMQQYPPQPAAPQPMAPVPADPRMQAAAPADPRLQGVPSDPRMQQAAAPADPRMQALQPPADPRMQAADPRLQAAQAPQPMQQAPPAVQPAAAAQPVAQLAPATQQQLLQQIMSMSQEQIEQLPPSHKAQVLALRSKMMGQG